MSYHGDVRLGDTIDLKFCTVGTNGAPTQLAGSPVVSAYPGNSTTQLTAGITLSVDFDSVTGLNNVRVVATSGNGYATATNYELVITTGTVGGTSVVGYVIGSFSIENRSALMPTTAARMLDVSAGGEAGLDWANVGSPTTTVGLSGTTVGTITTYTGNTPQTGDVFPLASTEIADILAAVDTEIAAIKAKTDNLPTDPADQSLIIAATDAIIADTNDIQSRLPAALTAGGNMKSDALAIDGSTANAAALSRIAGNLDRPAKCVVHGTVGTGSTTTSIVTSSLDPPAIATDQFKALILGFPEDTTTTALRGQKTRITTSAVDGTLTVEGLTNAPVSGDVFVIE
jgi:hypothetical protein